LIDTVYSQSYRISIDAKDGVTPYNSANDAIHRCGSPYENENLGDSICVLVRAIARRHATSDSA
jgi:hypothetical protein